MYEDQSQVPEAADIEREVTFQLAIDIDSQLTGMSKTLKETVEKLNSTYLSQSDPENPVRRLLASVMINPLIHCL